MELLQLNTQHSIAIDLRDAKVFGEARVINPEGGYLTLIRACGFMQTSAAKNGQNQDLMLVFQCESKEPGLEGIELIERIWIQNGKLTPDASMDAKQLNNVKIARDKIYTALLSVGYTEAQLATISTAQISPVLFTTQAPMQGQKIVKLFHKLEESSDPQTNLALYLKNGARKHHVNEEVVSASAAEYQAGKLIKPNRTVKSGVQQTIEQEIAIGVAPAGSIQPQTAFQPAGAPVGAAPISGGFNPGMTAPGIPTTIAQPTPGAVMAGPAVAGNPFAAPQTVGAPIGGASPFGVAPAPGFAATPNGVAPGLAGGLAGALPPRA